MLTCDEPTIQGIERGFAVNRASVGLFSTEGGKFIAGHSMGDEYKVRTATGLSDLWDGKPIRRLRSGDGSMFLPGRRLAMHLAVQPEIGEIMLSDQYLKAQGLLSRLLVIYPDSAIGTRFHRDEAADTAKHLAIYDRRVSEVLRQPLPLVQGKQNELEPRRFEMAPDAKRLWCAFADEIELRMADTFVGLTGMAGKLPEHAARLAAVLALFDNLKASELSAEDLSRGIALAQHYASEALRTFSAIAVTPDLHNAKILLHWLHTKWDEPAVSAPDIYGRGPNAIRDNATARKLVGILEAHGWLIKVQGGAVVNDQRRREAWRVIRDRAS